MHRKLAHALGITMVAAAAPAAATIVLALDLPALTWRAERILVGDVVSVRPAWDARHERIDTTVEVSVVEVWKGSPPPEGRVVVSRAGGTVDGVTMVVIGEASFTPGERAVVFLRGAGARSQLVGMSQGKRALRRDSAGRWIAESDAGGARTVAPDGDGRLVTASPATALPLDDLRAQVKALLGR